MKATPKSCSCSQCKHSKGSRCTKIMMKHGERSFRHAQKIALNKSNGLYDAAPHGPRYG